MTDQSTHPSKLRKLPMPQSQFFGRFSIALQQVHKDRWIYIFLGVLLIVYGLLTLNGYGNHDDIYRMIGTWRTLLSKQHYVPSRFQGYLVPEVIIGFSSQVGNFYLSNLVSASLAIASLVIFYQLILQITTPLVAALATFAVGANPYWIIAATTSTDYIYPVFFFFVGLLLLLQKRFRWAGFIFALAVSSRITYGPMVAIALGFYFPSLWPHQELKKQFFQGIFLFLISSTVLYLPVFFAAGMTFSFLGFASETAGGIVGDIARFIYKNVYLWGLPTFIVLLIFLLQAKQFYWNQICTTPFRTYTPLRASFHAVLWCFIYNELLFAKLPHQYQYLIPILFCILYFVIQPPDIRKKILCLSAIIALHIVHAVVNIDVLETYQTEGINQTIHSDGAYIRPSIKPGILLRDYQWRSIYQRRMTHEFNQQWQDFSPKLVNPR